MVPHKEKQYRSLEKSNLVSKMTSNSVAHIAVFFVMISAFLPCVEAQFCRRVGNDPHGRASWNDLVEALEESEGLAVLCPFEISGDRCLENYNDPNGYIVRQNSDLIIVCDQLRYNFDLVSGCTINCPHRHFTTRPYSRLLLDRITLMGSQMTSVKVQRFGELQVVNSVFERNTNENANGGAINISPGSIVEIEYTMFSNNEARNGGAILNSGTLTIAESWFFDNAANNGGGAIQIESKADTILQQTSLVNNRCGNYGPAVYDRFNTGVLLDENVACGNVVVRRNNICDGVYVRVSRDNINCIVFEEQCIPPTQAPTRSVEPSTTPTLSPTALPTMKPSTIPTQKPSFTPSHAPTTLPSTSPTMHPSVAPSLRPTSQASQSPSVQPSTFPSDNPSSTPTVPTTKPSSSPTQHPSFTPSLSPTSESSQSTSVQPSTFPSDNPSSTPTMSPTSQTSEERTVPITPSVSPSQSRYPSSVPSIDHTGSSTPSYSVHPTSISTVSSTSPTTIPSTIPSNSLDPSSSSSPSSSTSMSTSPSVDPSTNQSAMPSESISPSTFPSSIASESPSSEASVSNFPTSMPAQERRRQKLRRKLNVPPTDDQARYP